MYAECWGDRVQQNRTDGTRGVQCDCKIFLYYLNLKNYLFKKEGR